MVDTATLKSWIGEIKWLNEITGLIFMVGALYIIGAPDPISKDFGALILAMIAGNVWSY